jgi:hypothetical protein
LAKSAIWIAPRRSPSGMKRSASANPLGWIHSESAEKRLGADKLLGRATHLIDGKKQQAILLEKGACSDLLDRLDVVVSLGERGCQRLGSAVGEFRGCSVDHHQECVHLLWKCRIEPQFALAPRQPRRNELAGIGVDRDVFVSIDDANKRHHRCKDDRET